MLKRLRYPGTPWAAFKKGTGCPGSPWSQRMETAGMFFPKALQSLHWYVPRKHSWHPVIPTKFLPLGGSPSQKLQAMWQDCRDFSDIPLQRARLRALSLAR